MGVGRQGACVPREAAVMEQPMRLYSFSVSLSSEKVRWALDLAGLPYREVRLTPFVHWPRDSRLAGGYGGSLPILEADGQVISDSTAIFEWLAQHRAPFSLIPGAPAARTAVLAAEARFDLLGSHVLRTVYAALLSRPALMQALWAVDANPLQALALRAAWPMLQRLLAAGLDTRPKALATARQRIDRALTELDHAQVDGQRYLVGGRLSVADVTAAAWLAPLACPEEHPLFSGDDYREATRDLRAAWSGRPGLDWVRGLYRQHRSLALRELPAPVSARPGRRLRPAVS